MLFSIELHGTDAAAGCGWGPVVVIGIFYEFAKKSDVYFGLKGSTKLYTYTYDTRVSIENLDRDGERRAAHNALALVPPLRRKKVGALFA